MARDHALNRREFGFAIAGLQSKSGSAIQGGFVQESQTLGHRLRDRAHFEPPRETERVPVVIVGGGVAGLSAAWHLDRQGFHDFVLLEMEPQAGGNARWGENEIARFPWGAHYVPVPGPQSTLVRELFEELGVLRNGQWEERYLCHSPQERLFIHGRWQEALEPHSAPDQWRRFQQLIADWRGTGQFSIPMEEGWRKAGRQGRELDRTNFRTWLTQQGLSDAGLLWYADYACRDDYGASAADTSAWAGLHYFCARDSDEKGPLTWPEGNGWIVKQLERKLTRYLRLNTPVYRIERQVRGRGWSVWTERTQYQAACVIFAAPTFLASHLVDPAPPRYPLEHSPWVTANLTLRELPEDLTSEPAWDNVIYESPSLGYVDATHQSLRTYHRGAVWTWYHALTNGPVREQRASLLKSNWQDWSEFILRDLERAHPDIRRCVTRIDVKRYGHAMPRPAPGVMFQPIADTWQDTLFFANSDLSRLSLFEEAQYRGVRAAVRALSLTARYNP